jgi:hypothetical protein
MPETDHLRRELDREYPPLADSPPDWDDVLRRVRQRPPKRRRSGPRIVGVAIVLGVAALVAISPRRGPSAQAFWTEPLPPSATSPCYTWSWSVRRWISRSSFSTPADPCPGK